VVVELAVILALGIALIVVVAITGHGSVSNLTSRGITAGDGHYFRFGGGLMLAMLVGIATLVGFDAAANLAEEAKDPYRTVPRAIVASVVVASVVGMLFLIALTVAIPNIKAASNTDSAVALITRVQLGVGVQKVVLVAIMFSFFAAGVVTMATGARLVYAMSRDARFPAHQVMRRVNPRTQTPIPATILMFAGGVVLMVAVPGNALIQLIEVQPQGAGDRARGRGLPRALTVTRPQKSLGLTSPVRSFVTRRQRSAQWALESSSDLVPVPRRSPRAA
jgi:amino acid transporter